MPAFSEPELQHLVETVTADPAHARIYEDLIRGSGISITPAQGWVLWCIGMHGPATAEVITAKVHVTPDRLGDLLAVLSQLGYLDRDGQGLLDLTGSGRGALVDLIAASQERLAQLLVGHECGDRERAQVLGRLTRAVLTTMPSTGAASGA
jgi:DNA-binding MarR family transcriptional regulator